MSNTQKNPDENRNAKKPQPKEEVKKASDTLPVFLMLLGVKKDGTPVFRLVTPITF